MKKYKRMDKAVTAVIGTILLLGMAISLFSVLSVVVLSYPSSTPSKPSTNLAGMIDDEYLLIEHRGGESLGLNTQIILTVDDSVKTVIVGDYLDEQAKKDKRWGIGEWVIYEDVDLTEKQVYMSVVDMESSSVILTGSLNGT